MARLTSSQCEALQAVVDGRVSGRILDKTIPSLIKRGLMVQTTETISHFPSFGVRTNRVWTVYRLTPAGLEVYTAMRTKWHKSRLEKLVKEFERDLARAHGQTIPPEVNP